MKTPWPLGLDDLKNVIMIMPVVVDKCGFDSQYLKISFIHRVLTN